MVRGGLRWRGHCASWEMRRDSGFRLQNWQGFADFSPVCSFRKYVITQNSRLAITCVLLGHRAMEASGSQARPVESGLWDLGRHSASLAAGRTGWARKVSGGSVPRFQHRFPVLLLRIPSIYPSHPGLPTIPSVSVLLCLYPK